jgi:peptide chain release factor
MSIWRLQQRTSSVYHHARCLVRCLTSTSAALKKGDQFPPRIHIPDEDIKHSFVLGSGPGGQVINKTSSAAQLTHIPTGIVVKSQQTRSQVQNYKIARQILADRVDEHLNGKESRPALKQERKSKKKASADKKKRRKYRALEEGKAGEKDHTDGPDKGGQVSDAKA